LIGNESAEIGYQNTITATQQQISDAELWLKTAELNYDSILKNQNNTLWLAATNITNAQLAYQEAQKQYEKLKVISPITGTIWKILVDKWQEIRIGTPLLSIINNSDPIVEIGITSTEYYKINSGSIVTVEYMWKILSWSIISIGSQAAWNGLYNVIIKLNEKIDIIWDTAKIKISSQIDKLTLPLNIVHPLEMNQGYIYVLVDGKPEILNIELGKTRWDQIEILSEIPNDTQIITNDITNYNPSIHTLILK
jgi:frataxin-like iron-binding protein CyaY